MARFFADEDIIAYDTDTGAWSLHFDGSDVGLGNNSAREVDAFHIMDDGSILLSIVGQSIIANVGDVDDSDIVRFIPTSLGSTTSGTFELYFDGSDVNLTTNGEDVDAINWLPGGDLLISTSGGHNVGFGGNDEDVLRFSPTSLGSTTSGTWSRYFDGSDIGLSDRTEDVWGIATAAQNGDLYISTRGTFSAIGLSGDGADVVRCQPGQFGANTSCTLSMFWDGSSNGISGEAVDGISITDQ